MLSLKTFYEWYKSWNFKAVTHRSTTLKIATRFVCVNNTVILKLLKTCIPCWAQTQCELWLGWGILFDQRKQLLLPCFDIICISGKHQFYLFRGGKLCNLDIEIGLPYTHLQREIWNRPREGKWAMLPVCASYFRNDEDCGKKWLFIQNLTFEWVNLSQQNLRNVETGQCWYLAKRWARSLIHQIWTYMLPISG